MVCGTQSADLVKKYTTVHVTKDDDVRDCINDGVLVNERAVGAMVGSDDADVDAHIHEADDEEIDDLPPLYNEQKELRIWPVKFSPCRVHNPIAMQSGYI